LQCHSKENTEIYTGFGLVQYVIVVMYADITVALSGTVFIDRANRSSALKTFDNAVKQMKQNKVSGFSFAWAHGVAKRMDISRRNAIARR
jgi:hypothetical protein